MTTTTPAVRVEAPTRRELTYVGLGALGVGAGYVVIAAAHGALGVARNDDWLYYRSLADTLHTGWFQGDHWTAAFLAGQVFLAVPVAVVSGQSFAALQVMTAVLGAVGLWAAYDVVRSFLARGWALFCVGVLALGPVYGSLSASFMSDVPSFALQAVALSLGLRALRGERVSHGLLAASFAASILAFSVRQFSIVCAVAVLVAWIWREWPLSRPRGRRIGGTALTVVAVLVLLQLWRTTMTVSVRQSVDPVPVREAVRQLGLSLMTVLELATPAFLLVLVAAGAFVRRARPAALLVAVLAAVGVWLAARGAVHINYVLKDGSYSETVGPGAGEIYPSWGDWVKRLVLFAAAVGGGLALASLVPRVPRGSVRQLPLGFVLSVVYAAGVIGGTWVVCVVTGVLSWDRYFMPAVPFVAAVTVAALTHAVASPPRLAVALLMAAWAVVGFHYVDMTATQDGTKWRLAELVAAQGYPAQTIDGGIEWFGLHQPVPVDTLKPVPAPTHFWMGLFPDARVCVVAHYQNAPFASGATSPRTVAQLSQTSALGVTYTLVADEVDPGCRGS